MGDRTPGTAQFGRWIVVAMLAAAVGAVALAFGAERLADSSWEGMAAWAERARCDWESRDFRRPAFHGETRAGSAFARYATAFAHLAGHRDDVREVLRFACLEPARVDPARLAALRPAVAAMREGAHCGDARPPVRGGDGEFAIDLGVGFAPVELVHVAMCDVPRLLARGEGLAAVRLSLDAATMACDLLGSPRTSDKGIGSCVLPRATTFVWAPSALEALDEGALRLLGEGLQHADLALSRAIATAFDDRLLLDVQRMLRIGGRGWSANDQPPPWYELWPYVFSHRAMLADAFAYGTTVARELRGAQGERWPAREARLRRIESWFRAADNPLVRRWNVASPERVLRTQLAMLRSLRLLVDARRGVAPLSLEDPLGDGTLAPQPLAR